MLFVKVGREVAMRALECREHKAVITDIVDNKFIVIVKQDGEKELVRVDDIVLCENVYDVNNLKASNFFKMAEKKETTDFDRYKATLKEKVTQKLLKESKA